MQLKTLQGGPASGPIQGRLLLDNASGLGGKSGPEAKAGSVIGWRTSAIGLFRKYKTILQGAKPYFFKLTPVA